MGVIERAVEKWKSQRNGEFLIEHEDAWKQVEDYASRIKDLLDTHWLGTQCKNKDHKITRALYRGLTKLASGETSDEQILRLVEELEDSVRQLIDDVVLEASTDLKTVVHQQQVMMGQVEEILASAKSPAGMGANLQHQDANHRANLNLRDRNKEELREEIRLLAQRMDQVHVAQGTGQANLETVTYKGTCPECSEPVMSNHPRSRDANGVYYHGPCAPPELATPCGLPVSPHAGGMAQVPNLQAAAGGSRPPQHHAASRDQALAAAKAKGLFKQHIEEKSGVSAVPGPRAVWARFNRQ